MLRFNGKDPLPRGVRLPRARRFDLPKATPPFKMIDWVRRLPGRKWDSELGAWIATSVGVDPDAVLAKAGFEVDLSKGSRAGIASLADLYDPWVELVTEAPPWVQSHLDLQDQEHSLVWPRLTGYDALSQRVPAAGRWVGELGCWVVLTADLHASEMDIPEHVRVMANAFHLERVERDIDPAVQARSAVLAASTHIDDVRTTADELIASVGDVPRWFGFDLFGYQHAGSISVAAGHSTLVDEPGLGKTVQALAAAAIRGVQRLVVVCPPVVNTNWEREVKRSRLVDHMVQGRGPEAPPHVAPPNTEGRSDPAPDQVSVHGVGAGDARAARVVRFVSGRKEPELPEVGVAIVSDSLLAKRPALLDRLLEWAPDAMFYDEAHRGSSFDADRSVAVRALAEAVGDGLRVPITGTPLAKGPQNLPGILAVSGHLDPVFGGASEFLDRYCKRNHFNAWVPRPEMYSELLTRLEAEVWTRRTKAEVLPDLPKKLRSATYLDVDLARYRAAHAQVIKSIEEWVDDFVDRWGHLPYLPDEVSDAEASDVTVWARGNGAMVSLLRQAAGLAKVDAATQLIRDHVESTAEAGQHGPVYPRPLVVWVHHRVVGEAMLQAVPAAVANTATIRGGTSADQRGRIVDDFQALKIPVLVASISAAGVGITLTAGSDMKFVETDWVVPNITQAEDRQCRIGQTRPVLIDTLIAPGTLDERIHAVLQHDAEMLNALQPGGDNDPSVLDLSAGGATAQSILTELAVGVITSRGKRSRRKAA